MSLVRSTIKDVAAAAGVTAGTVSRALRGDPRVIEGTRRRIVEAAERLGYRPNLQARGLQTGRTGAIGLACPSGPWILLHPYFSPMHAGFTAAAAADGLRIILYVPPANGRLERDASNTSARELLDGRVDGTVIYQAHELNHEVIQQLQDMGLTVVLMNVDEEIPGFFQILSGAEQRARETLRWAADLGAKKVGVLGLAAGTQYNSVNQRGIESARLPLTVVYDEIHHGDPQNQPALDEALDRLFEQGIDTLVFSSDYHVAHYMQRRERGKAPQGLKLFAFGGTHSSAHLVFPGVHYMETDLLAAGSHAYALFKDALEKKPPRSDRLFWSRRPEF
jgi:DNA-binding LacI/PurR family transcriptional regulator